MSNTNKYCYLHVVQGDYGYGDGFEDLCQSENEAEMLRDLKDYRTNAGQDACYKIIRRRELREEC